MIRPLADGLRFRAEPPVVETAVASAAAVGMADEVAVLLLVDLLPASTMWGWSRLVLGSSSVGRQPGLRFVKVLGSGRDGGFGLRPSATRQGLFTLFDSERSADQFVAGSRIVDGYRGRAGDFCLIKLRAFSCRGSWDGRAIATSARAPAAGPIAALTRASIRPHKALEFWRHAPPAQTSLEGSPGCWLAAGLGEAPLLRQATFTLWSDAQAMDDYARQGAHLEAIRHAARGQFFSESMFVRFVPLSIDGQWKGRRFG